MVGADTHVAEWNDAAAVRAVFEAYGRDIAVSRAAWPLTLRNPASTPFLPYGARSGGCRRRPRRAAGRVAARNVAASLGHGVIRPYRHRDLGPVVDLGPFSAVARPLGVPLCGPVAALITRAYHLLALPSGAAGSGY